jgi:hypothetical protein
LAAHPDYRVGLSHDCGIVSEPVKQKQEETSFGLCCVGQLIGSRPNGRLVKTNSGTAAQHMQGVLQEGKHGGNLSQVVNEIANSVCFGDGPAFSKIALGHGLHAFRNYHCSISRSNLQF